MTPPFKITPQILGLIAEISMLIGEVKSLQLHKPPPELRKKNKIKTIQSSLEIEGNTLSLDQVTSLLENKRVLGPQKDIIEVKNAIRIYTNLSAYAPLSLDSYCDAHKALMTGLTDDAGTFRRSSVGIAKGEVVKHIAPPKDMVRPLMQNLFRYLKDSNDLTVIKSCVFHYEMEFIHPFSNGNGRMGRLWQTLILMTEFPVFEFVPIESIIKERQSEYYEALSESDKIGESTPFITFMLAVILDSLTELLNIQEVTATPQSRLEYFKGIIKEERFKRKDYLQAIKKISSATASRDLKYGLELKLLTKEGDKRLTTYRFKSIRK